MCILLLTVSLHVNDVYICWLWITALWRPPVGRFTCADSARIRLTTPAVRVIHFRRR